MITVIATVVYPQAEPFFDDFVKSLNDQTDTNVLLLLFNDQADLLKFENLKISYKVHSVSGGIGSNREKMIEILLNGRYDNIIFADIDDIMSDNRVEVSKKYLKDNDLICNDIVPLTENSVGESVFSRSILNNTHISKDFIKQKNIFGLSNTACKSEIVEPILINNELIAIDWYIFSLLIQNSKNSIFTTDCYTYYRQWSGNIAGSPDIITNKVLKEIEVKYFHYKHLMQKHKEFKPYFNRFETLKKQIELNNNPEEILRKYMNKDHQSVFWWDNLNVENERN